LTIDVKKKIIERYRLTSSKFRSLPTFLIIGAGKAGTTSLYDYLVNHPQIHESLHKEVHYFDTHYKFGLNWYKMHFPLKFMMSKESITGEASPYYLYHPEVPNRVKHLLPNVKLIIILRNSVERAYSQYQHEVRNGNENLNFEDAIEKESERLRNVNYNDSRRMIYSYLDRGKYAVQIKRWLKFFHPNNILIMGFHEITNLKMVFDFLDVKNIDINTKYKLNSGQYIEMKNNLREKLEKYFSECNNELFELITKNFGENVTLRIKNDFKK